MDNQKVQTEAEVIQDMAIRALPPTFVEQGAAPFVILPNGCEVANLEKCLPAPTRKKGTVALFDVDSFISMFNLHRTENSHIYANRNKCSVLAVFDDDGMTGPGWREHKAVYQCPISKEWEAWSSQSGQGQKQEEFAEFLENNLPDIYSEQKGQPSAAQLLEVATSFKINKKVNFASAKRLDNGSVSFEYVEDIQGAAGAKGQIKVPEKFWIAIPIFESGAVYQIECRFKYRLKEGQLFMWYDLYRAEKVRDLAFADVLQKVEEGCSAKPFNGAI